jgi:hypothetical protein
VAIDGYQTSIILTTDQKAVLFTITKNFDSATEIDIQNPNTIQSVDYLANIGLITRERAGQILSGTAPTQLPAVGIIGATGAMGATGATGPVAPVGIAVEYGATGFVTIGSNTVGSTQFSIYIGDSPVPIEPATIDNILRINKSLVGSPGYIPAPDLSSDVFLQSLIGATGVSGGIRYETTYETPEFVNFKSGATQFQIYIGNVSTPLHPESIKNALLINQSLQGTSGYVPAPDLASIRLPGATGTIGATGIQP